MIWPFEKYLEMKIESELTFVIDQWIYFIKNAENLDVIPENTKDKGLQFAYERGRFTKLQKDIAHNLIKLGLSNTDISTSTKLSLEQIQQLRIHITD
jgi:hypothetical protein